MIVLPWELIFITWMHLFCSELFFFFILWSDCFFFPLHVLVNLELKLRKLEITKEDPLGCCKGFMSVWQDFVNWLVDYIKVSRVHKIMGFLAFRWATVNKKFFPLCIICSATSLPWTSLKFSACLISIFLWRLKQRSLDNKKKRGDCLQRVKLKIRQ